MAVPPTIFVIPVSHLYRDRWRIQRCIPNKIYCKTVRPPTYNISIITSKVKKKYKVTCILEVPPYFPLITVHTTFLR